MARVDYLVDLMWAGLNNVASVNRKHGIHLAVTMTDPTESVLGPYGMELRRQCVRLAFPMESAAASRAFLEVGRDEGYPRGSVGLPVGQFIAAFSGRVALAATFHPSPDDIRRYAQTRLPAIRPFALPDGLAAALSGSGQPDEVIDGEYRTMSAAGSQPPTPNGSVRGPVTQAEKDGRALDDYIERVTSASSAAKILGQLNGNLGQDTHPSGEMIEGARQALMWRARHLHCERSQWALTRYQRH